MSVGGVRIDFPEANDIAALALTRVSPAELAQRCSVATATISRWKNHQAAVGIDAWPVIEEAAGVEPGTIWARAAQRLGARDLVSRLEFEDLAERFGRLEEAVLGLLDSATRAKSGTVTPINRPNQKPKSPTPAAPAAPQPDRKAAKGTGRRGPKANRPSPEIGQD